MMRCGIMFIETLIGNKTMNSIDTLENRIRELESKVDELQRNNDFYIYDRNYICRGYYRSPPKVSLKTVIEAIVRKFNIELEYQPPTSGGVKIVDKKS